MFAVAAYAGALIGAAAGGLTGALAGNAADAREERDDADRPSHQEFRFDTCATAGVAESE